MIPQNDVYTWLADLKAVVDTGTKIGEQVGTARFTLVTNALAEIAERARFELLGPTQPWRETREIVDRALSGPQEYSNPERLGVEKEGRALQAVLDYDARPWLRRRAVARRLPDGRIELGILVEAPRGVVWQYAIDPEAPGPRQAEPG